MPTEAMHSLQVQQSHLLSTLQQLYLSIDLKTTIHYHSTTGLHIFELPSLALGWPETLTRLSSLLCHHTTVVHAQIFGGHVWGWLHLILGNHSGIFFYNVQLQLFLEKPENVFEVGKDGRFVGTKWRNQWSGVHVHPRASVVCARQNMGHKLARSQFKFFYNNVCWSE